MSNILIRAISKHKGLGASKKLFDEIVNKHGRASGVVELPNDQYPTLVTFDHIDDSTSVKKVEGDDLEKHFGDGVKLKRITLEVTTEPVTRGKLGMLLTWLGEHPEPSLGPATSGNLANTPFYRYVHYGDFRKK